MSVDTGVGTKVGVVGGGYAGMAAAVTLAQRGIPVIVFESAKVLGGRARRVEYQGLPLDNGQHICIGAYRETLRLIQEVAATSSLSFPPPTQTFEGRLRRESSLGEKLDSRLRGNDDDRVGGGGNGAEGDASLAGFLRLPLTLAIYPYFQLKAAALPAPLHLALGLFTAQGVSWRERWAAARFMLTLRLQHFTLPQDMSVAELLRQHHQGGAMTRFLWNPLCYAALNTPPEIASAQVFLNVLRDSLNGSRGDSELLLSRVDLSALFPEPAARYVEARGGQVLVSHTVSGIQKNGAGFTVTAADEQFQFSHVICALPFYRAAEFCRGTDASLGEVAAMIDALEAQPIYTVYVQYPEKVDLPFAMLGLDGGYVQWVFDREALCGQRGLVAAVISAEGLHQQLSQDALAQKVVDELRQNFGITAQPLWHQVIAEKRATFACKPDLQRPAQKTPLENFYLAGDYTAGDYPATLEGAVRSGVGCAEMIVV